MDGLGELEFGTDCSFRRSWPGGVGFWGSYRFEEAPGAPVHWCPVIGRLELEVLGGDYIPEGLEHQGFVERCEHIDGVQDMHLWFFLGLPPGATYPGEGMPDGHQFFPVDEVEG